MEQKNLVRQNFIPADLGENKARVLAERYSTVFGMETEYVPAFIESAERLKELIAPRVTYFLSPFDAYSYPYLRHLFYFGKKRRCLNPAFRLF